MSFVADRSAPLGRVALIDRAGARRDALAHRLESQARCTLVVAERVAALPDGPEGLDALVVHTQAAAGAEWSRLVAMLPTLVLSDRQDDAALVEALEAGVSDYLVAPLEHEQLLPVLLRRAIEQYRRQQAVTRDRDRLERLNEQQQIHLSTLRTDLQAGGQIQRRLQPPPQKRLNGVTGDHWMAPSLYLSGDFLDYQSYGERYVLFCFADVAGHGASSAFITVLLKALFQRWLSRWNARLPENLPARWLARLNRELLDTGVGKHAAIVVGIIDVKSRMLYYSLGAQMPMPILATDAGVQLLKGEGPPVGLFPDIEYPTYRCALPAGFRLWLCSDGVFDCLPGENLEARLMALCSHISQAQSIGDLKTSLALSDALPDDLTFLTLSGFDDVERF